MASETITQADREAAANWMVDGEGLVEKYRDHIRSGKWDSTGIVQAFAAHRTAAVAELVEALEEVKRTLEEPQPAIACTIWAATSPAETLYDHVCTALSRHQAGMKDKDHG